MSKDLHIIIKCNCIYFTFINDKTVRYNNKCITDSIIPITSFSRIIFLVQGTSICSYTQLCNSCSFKTLLSPFSLTSKNSPKYSRYYLFWHSSTIMDFFLNPCMWVSRNRLYCISKFCVYSFDDSFNGPCHSSSEKLEGQNKFHFHLGCVQNGH